VAAEQVRRQFLREAQILASLHHPNLPRVTDFFVQNDRHYLVMDYIEGQSLHEVIQQNPHGQSEELVLGWMDQALSALEYIHEHHLIHRDIKPANIRLTPDGRIFLVDFGLARPHDPDAPRTTTMIHGLGTVEYSPPEQYDPSSHTDERSDLYALGATMYHLLTGELPASVTRRTSEPQTFLLPRASNPEISPEVEQVLLRAMELERAKRYATATDMRAALAHTRHLSASGTTGIATGAQTTPPGTAVSRRTRQRFLIAVGMLVMLVLAVVLIAVTLQVNTPAAPLEPTPAPHAKIEITLLSSSTSPEYIIVQNTGTAAQDLSGWYLESTVGPQVFNFPIGFVLPAGQSVRIESFNGATNAPPDALLWSTDAIWNNAGDKAVLRNAAGAVVSSKCYGDQCS
jgi:serine/threonine-protein kinase